MTYKPVMTLDPTTRRFRIGRWIWERGTIGDGRGYSAKLSLALTPRLWDATRTWNSTHGLQSWTLTLCGVRVSYQRAYGGRFT